MKIALFDMDGTLFDYRKQLLHDMRKLSSPDEKTDDSDLLGNDPWMKNRAALIKRTPGWWRSLPRFKLGWDIYNLVSKMDFECHILTKGPKKNPKAWAEKVECIADHFGDEINIDIVGTNKEHRYGHVLVDDYGPYVLGWLKHRPRGLAIMPAHNYNLNDDHPNIIRYNGNNIDLVAKALSAVLKRENHDHWLEHM